MQGEMMSDLTVTRLLVILPISRDRDEDRSLLTCVCETCAAAVGSI